MEPTIRRAPSTNGNTSNDGARRIVGSNYGSAVPAVDFPRYATLHLEGRLPVERLVTARIGLDDLEPAFERMRRGEGVRSVIEF